VLLVGAGRGGSLMAMIAARAWGEPPGNRGAVGNGAPVVPPTPVNATSPDGSHCRGCQAFSPVRPVPVMLPPSPTALYHGDGQRCPRFLAAWLHARLAASVDVLPGGCAVVPAEGFGLCQCGSSLAWCPACTRGFVPGWAR